MTTPPLFPGFDGLMTLSRREGVDIRPTLLRVLTDLYVKASSHNRDEKRQFVELTSRLIDHVDDATRAAVRERLAIYPDTPVEVLDKLGVKSADPDRQIPLTQEIPEAPSAAQPAKGLTEEQLRMASNLSMQPKDAAEINDMFFGASSRERGLILHSLEETPIKAATRVPPLFAARAIETLETAALATDIENFTRELGETLFLPMKMATQVVSDPGGEPLACALKALGMPGPVFQRVLIFLPQFGQSVASVYRLSDLYDRLSERSALVMLAAWRGSTVAATRAKYRPALYDDERHRARPAPAQTRPAVQPGIAFGTRNASQQSGS
jgi:uncharacterized protein DUF2336